MARCQKQDTKKELLDAGMKIMLEKGYTSSGLQQVLDAVGVPKGSFYHYFESKEDFALEIIQHYDLAYTESVLSCLRDQSLTPLQRLRKFCLTNKEKLEQWSCTNGCLIGNLSQEMASQSERLREKLEEVFVRWRDLFAAAIAEGQASGEIGPRFEALELADLFLSGWEGAVMRSKSTRSTVPIDNFVKLMFVFLAGARQIKASQEARPVSLAARPLPHV
jgi:TetR/AcrR family transcriptional regulator, transcriptional repressor for nem operon